MRFVIWAAIALTAIALGAGGAKLYSAFAPWSLPARNARTVPFGVSDFGRPLPEGHPFLQQHIANSNANYDLSGPNLCCSPLA